MPKFKIIASLLVLISGFVQAQKGFEIGPAIQFQSTWMTNKFDYDLGPELDVKPTYGMAYGGIVSYGFSNRHGIRTGVMLSQLGQKYTTAAEFKELPSTAYATSADYLLIPLMYRYNSDLGKSNTAFVLQVGPQFGMLQSVKAQYLVRNFVDSTASVMAVPDDSVKQRYNSMDISAVIGVGLNVRFSKMLHMNAMLNLSYSLQSIEQSSFKNALYPTRPSNTRNAVAGLQVSFCYLLGGPEMVRKTPVAP